MKNITIFIDSYNDVDHILPFIDYVLLNQKANIFLYTTKINNLSSCKDHLYYLKNTYGLTTINYDQNFSRKYSMFMNMYLKLSDFSHKAKQNSSLLPFLMLLTWLRPIAAYLTQQEVNKAQKDICSSVIMMDFGKELSLNGTAIVKYGQKNNVTVLGYLHGFGIYTNLDTLEKDRSVLSPIKTFILKIVKLSRVDSVYFDRYLVGVDQRNTLYSSSQMANFNKQYLYKVLEIGVPRFTYEWINKYKKHVVHSNRFTYGDNDRINVVLFMSHPQYNVNLDQLIATIDKLSSCNNINFVCKPHTRNGLDRIKSEWLNGGYDASKINSLSLSSWADVGIVYGSSIAFQLLQDKVPLIMPKYIHTNTTIFEENDACILANNLNDLMDILSHSKEDVFDMVDHKSINNLIKHYVYGDTNYNGLMSNFYHSVVDK